MGHLSLSDPSSAASHIEPLLTASSLRFSDLLPFPRSHPLPSLLLLSLFKTTQVRGSHHSLLLPTNKTQNTKNYFKKQAKMHSSAFLAALGAAGLAAAQTLVTTDTLVPVSTIVVSSPISTSTGKSFRPSFPISTPRASLFVFPFIITAEIPTVLHFCHSPSHRSQRTSPVLSSLMHAPIPVTTSHRECSSGACQRGPQARLGRGKKGYG